MSLFKSLTNTNIATKNAEGTEETPEAIGATALIQSLLEITAFDACTSKRNAFSTLSIISKARDLCKHIHTRIKVVDSSAPGSPLDNWDAFVEYTKAIDPLEELLFKLVDWLDKEPDKFLNQHDTIDATITFVDAWHTNRNELKTYSESVEELKKVASEPSSAYADLQKHDDRCLIFALCQEISATEFKGPQLSARDAKKLPTPLTLITKLKQAAGNIPSEIPTSIEEASMTLAAKCAMIVQGALYLGEKATEGSDLKAAFTAPLVWEKALSLLNTLSTHVSTPDKCDLAKIQTEYEEFLKFLRKLAVEIPAEYLDIKLSVKNIKRPYYARTVELALQCHMLVEYFVKEKKPSNLPPLEGALKAAIDALEATTSAMGIIALLDYKQENPGGDRGAMDKFDAAEGKVKACFETYATNAAAVEAKKEMTDAAKGLSDKMKTALQTDKDKYTKMRERFEKTKYTTGRAPDEVKLKIQKPGEDSTDKEATLATVLWSTLPAKDATTITEWRLEQGDGPTVKQISLNTQAKHIIDTDGPLRFVRGPLPPIKVDVK